MADLPLACTLVPEDRPARAALMTSLAADGVLERRPTVAGMRFVLRDTPEIERRVRELVALEAKCCAFLEFEIARDEDGLALDVRGAPATRPTIEQFLTPTLP